MKEVERRFSLRIREMSELCEENIMTGLYTFLIVFAVIVTGNIFSVIITRAMGVYRARKEKYRGIENMFIKMHGEKGKRILKILKKKHLVNANGHPISQSRDVMIGINEIFLMITGKTMDQSFKDVVPGTKDKSIEEISDDNLSGTVH